MVVHKFEKNVGVDSYECGIGESKKYIADIMASTSGLV